MHDNEKPAPSMKIDLYDLASAFRQQHIGCEVAIDLIETIVKVETQRKIEQAENRLRANGRLILDQLSVALRRPY